MPQLRTFKVSLRGLRPGLLMSNGLMADPEYPFAKRLEELRGKHAAGDEVERQRKQVQITGRLYLDVQDRIVLPADMLSSALRKGAALVNVKKGRGWWTGITVLENAVLRCEGLPKPQELHKHDRFVHRAVARVANSAPQLRYRPHFETWTAEVLVEIDLEALDEATLRRIFEVTGLSVGLGDWRPSSPKNPGKYGRFALVSIEEVRDELPAAAE
jgi:hypothetical protein